MSFYNCSCYFERNIYIKEYNWHFNYFDREQFEADYYRILLNLGCDTDDKKAVLLQKIVDEVNRRKRKEKNDIDRKDFLKQYYQPVDKSLYTLQENFFDASFIKLVESAKHQKVDAVLNELKIISKEKQIYCFPVFTEEFCERLLHELDLYNNSNLPKERPNTMNKNGILLDDIGFHDNFSSVLRENYLNPLAKVLFPDWAGENLDSHRIFIVNYNNEEESALGYHYDNSEVTLNVCLGKDFKGGDIYFGDMNSIPISESTCILVPHRIGVGLLHRGQLLHGTLSVTSGERHNLIMWMRASSIRNKRCPMCNSKPSKLLPASHYGDGFTLRNSEQDTSCLML